jgi:acetoin:2,6-dichlorophenolindophenol oxidoreductase subunit alpha
MQLDQPTLLEAYRRMKLIREFEETVHTRFEQGEIPGFVHLYAGQEAGAVGVCLHLDDDDYIGSTHRGHGHCIAKGCDVEGMMKEIFGRAGGLCGGKGGSMHIADIDKGMLGANAIVGGNPPLVVGAALTIKTKGLAKVAVSFTGDGASNQGTTFEAMNLAVVLGLPAIFVFENNGYGEGTGVGYAVGADSIAERAAGFGLPARTVDGRDFFAVFEAAREAIERARAGGGPSAIEIQCMRQYGHFIGDAQAYRSKAELDRCRAEDPLAIFRQRAAEEGRLDTAMLDGIDAQCRKLVADAVEAAHKAPAPDPAELLTDVYVSY